MAASERFVKELGETAGAIGNANITLHRAIGSITDAAQKGYYALFRGR